MNHSMPSFPVLHYLLGSAQTHVLWVSDATQPSGETWWAEVHRVTQSQTRLKWLSTPHIGTTSLVVPGFPGGSNAKESSWNVVDTGLTPGLGSSPREENDNPLQYSCLVNSMDRGVWRAIVHGIAKSQTWLSDTSTRHFLGYIPGLLHLNLIIILEVDSLIPTLTIRKLRQKHFK